MVVVVVLAASGLTGACVCPSKPPARGLQWRLYQCDPREGCYLAAAFQDGVECFRHEQFYWSNCDPAEVRAGRLRCQLPTEEEYKTFAWKTICVDASEGVPRWEDVADAGRPWSFY